MVQPRHGEYKVPDGKLVTIDLEVADDRLSNVRLSGDFFLDPDEALPIIDEALNGLHAETTVSAIAAHIESELAAARQDGSIPGPVTMAGFDTHAIAMAVRRALGHATGWADQEFTYLDPGPLDPAMHVALDEVLGRELAAGRRGPTFRFWEWSQPAVVIGSFQSLRNEVDAEAAEHHQVQVVRRISGGGAMFMEAGNCITFSLVVPTSLVDGLSYEASYAFLDQWVLTALAEVGVKARYAGLNDIASDAGKLAGAAQKRFVGGALLHHVTMAYDIDAVKMNECLRIGKEKIRDKGLRSAVKRVDPMRSQTGMAREDIIEVLKDHFAQKYLADPGEITAADLEVAERRAEDKFSSPEWVYRIP